ncbi:I78 family peptidase inhibitor [uncultured Shimia sp.]|uniref:I78 family peptidase inhibitor n=1 Tax=uncultured Shimia sp. TaxID=573152 RepID=UPI002612D859|nr:I78 family peptidase inhibitor [uncultured Shimia sp.]
MKWIGLVAFVALAACINEEEETAEMKGSETCDPAAFEFLIGQDKSAVDGVTTPETVRVLGESAAMTMDHRPDRLNVFFDDNGVIVKVTCG